MASLFPTVPQEMLLVISILAFLESCIGIGLFVSGIFLLSTCSLIYLQGDTSLFLIAALALGGAMAGDHTGYFVGLKAGPALWRIRWVRKRIVKRKNAYRRFTRIMLRSAPWAICVGRLTPAIRSVTPALAGVSGIKSGQFFIFDLLACSIWAAGLSILILGIDTLAIPTVNLLTG
jgi:membrane-associated protein